MQEKCNAVENHYDHFSPEFYLDEYYAEMGDENRFLMDFHAWCSHFIAGDCAAEASPLLADVGGGPTIYQLISTTRLAREIHFYEYGAANRRRVEHWLREPGDGFWDRYFYEGLAREGDYLNGHGAQSPVTRHAVEARKAELRAKLVRCADCDLLLEAEPYGRGVPKAGYGIVSSAFCVEAISGERGVFMRGMDNIVSLCAGGGYFMMTVVVNCSAYPVGDRLFPAYPVDGNAMREILEARGFELVKIATTKADPPSRGYEGLMGILAKRAMYRTKPSMPR